MEKKIAYVGIDYHLNSLSIAVMVEGEMELGVWLGALNMPGEKVVAK
ncbi:MAG: hypothetical protein JRI36_05455 [Deltaproteobacteria bacterium]|nr:hypothetical protein [Deltaproteobacteria bacterium]